MELRDATTGEILELISKLRRRWLCWLRERASRLGLGVGQMMFLKFLDQNGKLTAGEAAEHLGVAPSAVTAMADRLCAQGILERSRDTADRRQVWLSLTAVGRAEVNELIQALQGNTLERLDDEDLQDLRRILIKLEAGLREDGIRGGTQDEA